METCRQCGARLTDENELERHNEQLHQSAGKKGGERDMGKEQKPGARQADRLTP